MQGEKGEENMDSSSIVRSTASGADYKRSDNGGGSKFSKNYRKREGSGSRPRNDSQPKKQNYKTRGYTKRPQPRGYGNGSPRSQMTEAQEAEFGSALQTGSKKANLNHLLNFTIAPREGVGGRGATWKNRNNWGGKKLVKYNKEQFLQANCQFVVHDAGDYMVHAADPDMLVEWDLIQQVRIQSHEVPNCPICLFPAVAAKMTRCGHIYCWTCILHYLALGEKSWRKCPICYEAVHKKDLKSVVALKTRQYSAGDEITMVLMKRERGSTYTMPKSQWQAREAKPHSVDDEVDTRFVKLLSASIEHVQNLIDEERKAIMEQMAEESSDESIEQSFSKAALELLKEREDGLRVTAIAKSDVECLVDTCSPSDGIKSRHASCPSFGRFGYDDTTTDYVPVMSTPSRKTDIYYASAFDEELIEPDSELSCPPEDSGINMTDFEESLPEEPRTSQSDVSEDAAAALEEAEHVVEEAEAGPVPAMAALSIDETKTPQTQRPGSSKMTSVYYFYQADDGQHIYLNSLNARCLIKEYGSLENAPETIKATIVDIESISMSEDLRRRLKYLSHLPLTCEFQIAELALKSPIISSSTIKAFAGDIERKQKMRKWKEKQEKRVDRRMKRDEDSKSGKYPAMRAPLTSSRHFPACGTEKPREQQSVNADRPVSPASDVSTPLGSPPAVNLNPYAMEFTPGSPFTPSSLDNGNQTATVSFAQMLRDGQRKVPEIWPKSGLPQDGPKVVRVKAAGSDESDSEDRAPIPQYQDSFGNAIQQALDNYTTQTDGMEDKGKKKKKKQKKLLFTTTMARK